jgi:hypothetical protein
LGRCRADGKLAMTGLTGLVIARVEDPKQSSARCAVPLWIASLCSQ